MFKLAFILPTTHFYHGMIKLFNESGWAITKLTLSFFSPLEAAYQARQSNEDQTIQNIHVKVSSMNLDGQQHAVSCFSM